MLGGVRRSGPTRATLAAVVGLVWALSSGVLRDVVWADVRAGLTRTRGFSRTTRSLIYLGFGLLAAVIVALLFADIWRAMWPLLPLPTGQPGRGGLLPLGLVPATFFLLTLAWSFILAGALRCHPLIRLLALAVYLPYAGSSMLSSSLAQPYEIALALGSVTAVPFFYALRWRAQPRPTLEFALLLACVALTSLLTQMWVARAFFAAGVPVMQPGLLIEWMRGLVLPLLLLAGLDIAMFLWRVSSWTTAIARARLPRALPCVLLPPLLVWRSIEGVREVGARVQATSVGDQAAAWLGALGVPLTAAFAVWFVRRSAGSIGPLPPGSWRVATAAERLAPRIILAYSAFGLLASEILLIVVALSGLGLVDPQGVEPVFDGLLGEVSPASGSHLLLYGLAIVGAYGLSRRNRVAAALYLAAFGAHALWFVLTGPGQVLEALGWRGQEPVEFWWVVIVAVFCARWLVRRRLTPDRALRLVVVLIANWLLGLAAILSEPVGSLAGLFGAPGVALIAVGLGWAALTSGAWTNTGTPALPRVGRVFLYLGYALLTGALVNWALSSHDMEGVAYLTEAAGLAGFAIVGKPLIYLIFATTLGWPADRAHTHIAPADAQPFVMTRRRREEA